MNKIKSNRIIYEVVEANTAYELSEILKGYLAAGYKLHGGVCVVNLLKDGEILQAMYQALTLEEEYRG